LALRRFLFFNVLHLLADLAGASQSSGDTKLWQDVNLKQEPHKENGQYDQYIRHSISLQPPAETTYAHENPREDVAHGDDTEAPAVVPDVLEEKIDSRRSGFGAAHLGHLTSPLSLEKTICSNSLPHLGQRNSYSGIDTSSINHQPQRTV